MINNIHKIQLYLLVLHLSIFCENLLLYTFFLSVSKVSLLSSSFIRAVVVAVQVSVQADRPDRGRSDRVDQSVCLLHSSTVYNHV